VKQHCVKLILLTHSREFAKPTNTGRLVAQALAERCWVIPWQRVSPDAELLSLIEQGRVALIYPCENSAPLGEALPEGVDHWLLIDGTWQEAKKIYNRSPYLQQLPSFTLPLDAPSRYFLRRNQTEQGLCTAECSELLLKLLGDKPGAAAVASYFDEFLEAELARRS